MRLLRLMRCQDVCQVCDRLVLRIFLKAKGKVLWGFWVGCILFSLFFISPCSMPDHLNLNILAAVLKLVYASSQSAKLLVPLSLSHAIHAGDAILMRSAKWFAPQIIWFLLTLFNSLKYSAGGGSLSRSLFAKGVLLIAVPRVFFVPQNLPAPVFDDLVPLLLPASPKPYGGSTIAKSNALSSSVCMYCMQSILSSSIIVIPCLVFFLVIQWF